MTIKEIYRADLKLWRVMTILYIVLAILATMSTILNVIKMAAAIAAAVFGWFMIVSPILWLICAVGYVVLSIIAHRQWKETKQDLKELDNVERP